MHVLMFVLYVTRASGFSSDKMFPALGFGARIPPDFKVCPLLFTYFNLPIAPYTENIHFGERLEGCAAFTSDLLSDLLNYSG